MWYGTVMPNELPGILFAATMAVGCINLFDNVPKVFFYNSKIWNHSIFRFAFLTTLLFDIYLELEYFDFWHITTHVDTPYDGGGIDAAR